MRYQRLRSLGRGSFGEVFHARDTRTGEEVALKVSLDLDASTLEAFKNEARLLYDVVHPGLITPDEVVLEDGAIVLVMPYIEGESFVSAFARADEAGRDRLLGDLLEALVALHDHDILHLDLKAANVRVTAEGRVAVLDFGLSRVADRPHEGLVGTPDTMAPEQLSLGVLSAATDLYAIGAMVFEALAGHAPFAGQSPLARLLRPAPTLDEPRWGPLLTRLASIDPARRPSSAELLRFVGREPVVRARPTFVGRSAELAVLERIEASTRAGASAIVTVTGDAAAGKTELVHRFALAARDRGARVVWSRCYPEGQPFGPLDGAFDELARDASERPQLLIIDDAQHGDATTVTLMITWLTQRVRMMVLVAHRAGEAWARSSFGVALEQAAQQGLPFEHARIVITPIGSGGTFDARGLSPDALRFAAFLALSHGAIDDGALARVAGVALPTRAERRLMRPLQRATMDVRIELARRVLGDLRAAHTLLASIPGDGDTRARHWAAAEHWHDAYPFAALSDDAELLALARRVADTPELQLRHAAALSDAGLGVEASAIHLTLASTREGRARRDQLRAAAAALLVVGAVEEGRALLEPLRALDDLDAAERFDTTWPLARALAFVHPREGFALLQEALAFAEASGDSARLALVSGPFASFVLGAEVAQRPVARAWVAAIGRSAHPAASALQDLWTAFLAATEGDPMTSLALGRAAIDNLGCGLRWERFQAVTITVRALLDLGHWSSLLSLVDAHLVAARRVDDRYMIASLSAYQLVALIARGRCDDARAVAAWVRASWQPGRWTAQSLYADFADRMVDLYEGRVEAAAIELASRRGFFEQGGGYRVVFQRLDHDVLETRIGLAHDVWPDVLWTFETLIERLDTLAIPAGPAHAQLMRACAASEPAPHLDAAIALFDALAIVSEAEVARLRRAQLADDAAAAERARVRLRRHGVHDPDRWADLVAPWLAHSASERRRV